MLYFEHAELYDEMYEVIFDYDEQFSIVDTYMCEKGMSKVLEVTCGTGKLVKRLYEKGYDVTGLDISEGMLSIARDRVPEVEFIQGDIRGFDLEEKFDTVVCFGHSFAYMVTDEEVYSSLDCFNEHLEEGGLLMMDNFDALQTIEGFEKYRERVDRVKLDDKLVERNNFIDWNIGTGISWDWECKYKISRDGEIIEEFSDEQVLRSFLRSELEYFLGKTGFKVIDFDKERFLHVAEKIENH